MFFNELFKKNKHHFVKIDFKMIINCKKLKYNLEVKQLINKTYDYSFNGIRT